MQHPFANSKLDSVSQDQTSEVVGGQRDDSLNSPDPSKAKVTKHNGRIVGPPVFYTQALGEDGGFVPPSNL